MRIEEIDKNFLEKAPGAEDLVYYDAAEEPMIVEGLPYFYEDKKYNRIKPQLWNPFSDGLKELFTHTAGGCVRFITNSKKIAIRAELNSPGSMNHMPNTGSSGFDIYIKKDKKTSFLRCAFSGDCNINSMPVTNLDGQDNEIIINFPLYNGFKYLHIGLEKDACLKKPKAHTIEKPILFYGSSITQGGCASRPGNMYSSIIGRRLDAATINFGFSGCAHGEPEMAKIISGLDMSCFVMDYDHNEANPDDLRSRHSVFFNIIRDKNPDLPVIMVTRPDIYASSTEEFVKQTSEKRAIVYETYYNAVKTGDKNVYFVGGETLFAGIEPDSCTVDGCHPNDLGFHRMANVIGNAVKLALNI